MIGIIDYGLGNVSAFLNVYRRLNIPASVVSTAAQVESADKLILPGVGAFDHAMERLSSSGMRDALDRQVMQRRVPILGVCVGMQILGSSSDEGRARGLSWIDGHVEGFRSLNLNLLLPHMGWNDVQPVTKRSLFEGLEEDSRFYFLHSFYMRCKNEGNIAAISNYGIDFACAVQSDNIHGVQFHPEKSHHFGRRLLKNFAEL